MARFGRPCLGAAAFLLAGAMLPLSSPAAAQDSRSVPVAKELIQALNAAKLESVAVADPATSGAFIAALYIPGTQLLVVAAKYSAPTLLIDRIGAKDYMGVYVDLQSASVRGTKVFVQDQGADGLTSKPDGAQAADSWEEGEKSVAFDGDWKKAKIAEADYSKAYSDADDRYARMLSTLLAQVKQMRKAGS